MPGTYVKEGDPIVTVQMVDPMLVEFEVTAANSRRYQRGDALGVSVETPDGKQRELTGMVYTVDTIADANTRTFTVSLHVRNEPVSVLSESADVKNVATTVNIFPLNLGPIVTGDQRLLVEQGAIHQIGGEDFVWKVTNRSWSKLSYSGNRALSVERLKVETTSEVIPFLGTWNFVAIKFDEPSKVNLNQDLITGKLTLKSDDPSASTDLGNWTGDRVLLEQTRWMLRAGDTVSVAMIPDNSASGFYVPMKAVGRENGKTFIHVIDRKKTQTETSSNSTLDATEEPIAKRVFVNVTLDDSVMGESLMLCIEPIAADLLQDGCQVVVGGTHYLDDGDRVRIVPQQRGSEGGR